MKSQDGWTYSNKIPQYEFSYIFIQFYTMAREMLINDQQMLKCT